MPVYKKLVRDKIPEIIEGQGRKCNLRVMDQAEYRTELLKKLVEEANESVAAGAHPDELTKELGDVLEVLEAIEAEFGLSPDEVIKLKKERHESRGGFSKRIYLESAD